MGKKVQFIFLALLIASGFIPQIAYSGSLSSVVIGGWGMTQGSDQTENNYIILEAGYGIAPDTNLSGYTIECGNKIYTLPDKTVKVSSLDTETLKLIPGSVKIDLPVGWIDPDFPIVLKDKDGNVVDSRKYNYSPGDYEVYQGREPSEEEIAAQQGLLQRDGVILPKAGYTETSGVLLSLGVTDTAGQPVAGYPIIVQSLQGEKKEEVLRTLFNGNVVTSIDTPGNYVVQVPEATLQKDANGNSEYVITNRAAIDVSSGLPSIDGTPYGIITVWGKNFPVEGIDPNQTPVNVGDGFVKYYTYLADASVACWKAKNVVPAPEFPYTSGVYISEVETNPEGSDAGKEFIEFTNPTRSEVNLKGYTIVNGKGTEYKIDVDTKVPAGGRVTVTNTVEWLDNTSESLTVKDTSGNTVDGTAPITEQPDDDYTSNRVFSRATGEKWTSQWKTPGEASGVQLYGKALDDAGNPLIDADIYAYCPLSPEGVNIGKTDEYGHFTAGFPAGSQRTIKIVKDGYKPTTLSEMMFEGESITRIYATEPSAEDANPVFYDNTLMVTGTNFGAQYSIDPNSPTYVALLDALETGNVQTKQTTTSETTTTTTETTTTTTTPSTTTPSTTTPGTTTTPSTTQPTQGQAQGVPGYPTAAIVVALLATVFLFARRRT